MAPTIGEFRMAPTIGESDRTAATLWYSSSSAETHDHSHWYIMNEPWKDNSSEWKTYNGTSWVSWDDKNQRIENLERALLLMWTLLKKYHSVPFCPDRKKIDKLEELVNGFIIVEEEEEKKDENPKHLEDKLFEL